MIVASPVPAKSSGETKTETSSASRSNPARAIGAVEAEVLERDLQVVERGDRAGDLVDGQDRFVTRREALRLRAERERELVDVTGHGVGDRRHDLPEGE